MSILLAGLAQARGISVYLHPAPSSPPSSSLSTSSASFALARHLGLDIFETNTGRGWNEAEVLMGEVSFVGQGPKGGLVLSLEERHMQGESK